MTQGTRALRDTLAERQCLLVVDDVWSAAARAFAVTGPRGRVVYTTRNPDLLASVGAHIEHVDVLSEELARSLLAQVSGTRVAEHPAEVDRVLAGTGRVALALSLVATGVRGGRSWAQVAAELDRGERVFATHPYANAFKTLRLAVSGLDKEDRDLYLSLAVFPRDTPIPLSAIRRYWQRLRGDGAERTSARLREFADRQLLSFDGEQVGFHDLQHDYLLLEVDDLEVRHADLLAAYGELLPPDGDWSQLPHDEPYLWDHLVHHLHGAGETSELVRTVTDPAYLVTRAFLHGPAAAEADLRHTADLLAHPHLDWWQQWFAHHGHLLADLPTLGDTAASAALRLTDTPAGVHADRLTPLLSAPYLTPLWGLTRSPQNLRRVLAGHHGEVLAVAFSPDGDTLATGGHDGTVRLWDPTTGICQATLDHPGWVREVTFSPDGHTLATGGHDGTVRLWDLGPPTLIRILRVGVGVTDLAWHVDLLAAVVDRSVVVFQINQTPVLEEER